MQYHVAYVYGMLSLNASLIDTNGVLIGETTIFGDTVVEVRPEVEMLSSEDLVEEIRTAAADKLGLNSTGLVLINFQRM